MLREDYYGETRSELFIQKTGLADNGTYHCQAENKAARVVSNFTLHVTEGASAPTILEVMTALFHHTTTTRTVRVVLSH